MKTLLTSTSALAVLAVGLFAAAPVAHATFINDAATGLAAPAFTQDFSNPALADNSVVTNQFARVSFTPSVYYNPQTGFGFTGNTVGNFTFASEPAFINPVTLTFSTPVTGAAFLMAADDTPYTFTALLGGIQVDSGSATVTGTAGHFGFTGEVFDRIVIDETASVGGGPYWLLGDLQLSAPFVREPARLAVPEPASLVLLGVSFVALGAMRRRKRS